MNRKEKVIKLSNDLAKTLRKANVTVGDEIAILEMLKIDLLINSGMVVINNKPLELVKHKARI
mgnify:CR=1 FL=1